MDIVEAVKNKIFRLYQRALNQIYSNPSFDLERSWKSQTNRE